MGLRMKKNIYFGDSQKNLMLKEGPQKNLQGGLPKKRGLGQFVDLRTAWQKRGVVFKGSIPQCTLCSTQDFTGNNSIIFNVMI